MPPNKRKKKAAANPSRGFATTSQPSKSKEISEVAGEDETTKSDDGSSQSPSVAQTSENHQSPDTLAIQDMSPEQLEHHLEDAELQAIVDSYAVRCSQDARRQVTKLEQERRQLKSQVHVMSVPTSLLDQSVDNMLQSYIESSLSTSGKQLYDASSDPDLLIRLWTLRKTLSLLRMPDVDKAIEHILTLVALRKVIPNNEYSWGLREALEWYAIRYEQGDLPNYDNGSITNKDLALGVANDVPTLDTSPIATSSLNVEPQCHLDIATNSGEAVSDNKHDDAIADLSPLSSSESEADEPSLFDYQYIRLQTLLYHTQQKMSTLAKTTPSLQKRMDTLNRRIDRIRRDVLFDVAAADITWKETLHELQIHAIQSAPSRKSPKDWNGQKHSEDTISDDDGDMLADMFSINESVSDTQPGIADNSTVNLVDFGKWTGLQPRRLLSEVCCALDKAHQTKFNTITTSPNSTRQKVHLQWSSDRDIDEDACMSLPNTIVCIVRTRSILIEMKSIATANAAQAESYLSTVILFLLIHSRLCESKQSTRLPTVWRHLYADFDTALGLFIKASEKQDLKHLRNMISQSFIRPNHDEREVVRSHRQQPSTINISVRQRKMQTSFSEDEARRQWEIRESSMAYQKLLHARKDLPVYKMKNDILASVDQNPLTIICADTGAGKSTQVPAFILEHRLSHGHDCKILVTQPRRISAISLAKRVSQELGEDKWALGTENSLLGYAIRLESKTSKSTRLTFATTGVLLRMIESSAELDELNYLILDEVHERTMDLDLLFIALRRLQARRTSLRLVLMSATVDAQKFSNYFGGAPVLNIPGRTFPVEVRYLEDALEDTLDMKPHGIHVVSDSDADSDTPGPEEATSAKLANLETYSGKVQSKLAQLDEYRIDYGLTASLIEAIATKEKYDKYSRAILVFMPGIAEIRRLNNEIQSRKTFAHGWVVHLLHSSFSTDDLEKAFAIPARGFRKIVIATNIAETGITIPDVTAVVDTCKEKVMRFDERRQLSRLTEGFISRSSARQRKGRAARVQEGLCFHMVTRYRYENLMLEQHVPEMLRLSLQDPILRIKVWNLGPIEETLAAAIDPPTSKNVRRAIERLKDAGALSSNEELTDLGKRIALLPLEVVLGKLAILGVVFQCLDAVLTIIAILSSKSPFVSDKSGRQDNPKLVFAKGDSDLISTLSALQGWQKARTEGVAHQFCRRHHLSDQNLIAIEDQKVQLMVYLVDAGLVRLDADEKTLLNNARNSRRSHKPYGFPNKCNKNKSDELLNIVLAMAFYPKMLLREGKGWRNVYTNQQVNLMPDSVISSSEKPPKWLCFYEAMQSRNGRLHVIETSRIPEIALATVLGAADFRFFAGVITLDNGRIKLFVRQWRELAVIKTLRECLTRVLEDCWATPDLSLSPWDRQLIDTFVGVVAGKDTKLT